MHRSIRFSQERCRGESRFLSDYSFCLPFSSGVRYLHGLGISYVAFPMPDGNNYAIRTKLWQRLVIEASRLIRLTQYLQFISSRVYEMRSQMNSGKFADPEKMSMLQRLLQRDTSSIGGMSDQDIVSEGMGHTCVP